MNEPHDPNVTADIPSSVPVDSLDAGLAAGFGRPTAPRSSLGDLRPVLLKEAEGESGLVVKPKSDAMPSPAEAGDRYQLSGEIARGGMGAVLRGRDVDLGRDLAVKVLLDKYVHRPEIARRFVEEAQIGGQLQHPGVVPVYDIGRFGDRPYFTMKLVKGQTLAALLEERGTGVPLVPGDSDKRDACPTAADRPRFLSIALQVAQTLAYAHAKGVIHRDLKPANVMVGAFGEVQVMDWGLAKVLAEGGVADEERSHARQHLEDVTTIRTARSSGSTGSFGTDTEAGSLLGTPAYMPPEQANGDVANLDRRADVFGLGAILCEILTGKPPYVGRSGEEVRRKACNGNLADALARLDACGADPELVALTKACLAREAIDRPKDAQAVADRLSAHLNGVQERLRQAELSEAAARAKALEEVKRRRLTLALAATVLLAVTLGGGAWLWVKNERDVRQAQLTRDVNDALNQVMALREKAKATGGSIQFAQAREQVQRAVALSESGPVDLQLAARVKHVQVELDEEAQDRQLVNALDEARLAQAETVVSDNRFAKERALPLFRQAFRAYGLTPGEDEPAAVAERILRKPNAVREAIVAALDEWDDLATRPGVHEDETLHQWVQAVLAAAEPGDDWTRQVRAARSETDEIRRRAALAALARSTEVRKVPALALTRLASRLAPPEATDLLRRAQSEYPADFWVNHDLGWALRAMTPPRHDEAVRFHTAAVALRPESPGARFNLGVALRDHGRLEEAIACYRQAIALDPHYAAPYHCLGSALARAGRGDEALACFRELLKLSPMDPWAHFNLALSLRAVGDVDSTITSLQNAIRLDPRHPRAHDLLGATLCDVKRDFEGAARCFRRSIELAPASPSAHGNLGIALYGMGRLEEAITSYRKAIELDPTYASAHYNLGNALRDVRQVDEAILHFQKAVELDPSLALAHNNLGNLLRNRGQVKEAIACFQSSIELQPDNAEAHCNLGHALNAQGRFADALVSLRRGHELGSARPGWPYPSETWVAEAEQNAVLEEKLPAVLKGKIAPKDVAEHLGFIGVCHAKRLHYAAMRLFITAFAANPQLAEDTKARHRYVAASNAALAAAGQGEDAANLDDVERTRLRKQALDWLRADLTLRAKQLESGQHADRAEVRQALRHWQNNPDLASIRDKDSLAKLPVDEQTAFAQFWADVATLLKKAEAPAREEKP